jgi:hypothetical protein
VVSVEKTRSFFVFAAVQACAMVFCLFSREKEALFVFKPKKRSIVGKSCGSTDFGRKTAQCREIAGKSSGEGGGFRP